MSLYHRKGCIPYGPQQCWDIKNHQEYLQSFTQILLAPQELWVSFTGKGLISRNRLRKMLQVVQATIDFEKKKKKDKDEKFNPVVSLLWLRHFSELIYVKLKACVGPKMLWRRLQLNNCWYLTKERERERERKRKRTRFWHGRNHGVNARLARDLNEIPNPLTARNPSPAACVTMVKRRYIGDGNNPTFNRNPYNGYINPYYWVDDHPLLYGNNGRLDPGTCILHVCIRLVQPNGIASNYGSTTSYEKSSWKVAVPMCFPPNLSHSMEIRKH